jgi:hypothetical protein
MVSTPPTPTRPSHHVISRLLSKNKGELININICWIYLQAISMSDICNFDGTHITHQVYDGTFVMKKTNIRWPNQHRPSKGGFGLYGVGSSDQSMMEIDTFSNLLVIERNLPFCIMIMNGTLPHPILP